MYIAIFAEQLNLWHFSWQIETVGKWLFFEGWGREEKGPGGIPFAERGIMHIFAFSTGLNFN